MVMPKIAICPICGKKTYLRIEVGGYLRKYPIRVHCINCHALIKGEFIMDVPGKPGGLHLQNAQTEECDSHSDGTTVTIDNADFVIDISGELPSKKVRLFDGKMIASTPFLEATDKVDMLARIPRLEYFVSNMEEWERWKSIAFQLLNDGGIEYIAMAVKGKMGQHSYSCDNYLKSLHCLEEVILEETRNLFYKPTQDESVSALISSLSQIDRTQLHEFVERIGGTQEIITSYRKIVSVFSSFMDIYPNILPAETYMRYSSKESTDYGIATCSFGDLKTFYQDAYEAILSLIQIPVCLDNIIHRSKYGSFHPDFNFTFGKKRYRDLNDDFERYMALDKGYKLDTLRSDEIIQQAIGIVAHKDIRNGIGHNNIQYDGITQLIVAPDMKDPGVIKFQMYLIDFAVDCLELVKSCVLLAEVLLFILRQELQPHMLHSVIHPRFYKGVEPNEKCPCGSNRKYKKCCKPEIDNLLR